MLRKLKWQIPGEPLAARCNWCQGSIPGRGLAVERHWRRRWASCWNQRCENRRVPDLMNVVDGVKAFGFISWNCMTVWRAAWRHIAGTCRRTTNRGVLFVIAGLKQWRTEKGGLGCSNPPPRNSEDIGGVLDRMSKKNRRLDFHLQFTVFSYGCNLLNKGFF